MFGGHFYHATTRKAVAIFGTLFNNLKVIRQDGSGNVLNQIKVPHINFFKTTIDYIIKLIERLFDNKILLYDILT